MRPVATLLLLALSVCAAASAQGTLESARRITPDEASQLLKKSKAVIVDIRDGGLYMAGHVKGALWIPLDELGSRVKELPRDKMVIAYDSSLHEHTSARAVLDLHAKGIDNAAALLGGYNAWVKAGYPTSKH